MADKKYVTGFVVLVEEDGSVVATSDLETSGVTVGRDATFGDMRQACGEVIHDINAMQTAQGVIGSIAAQARAAAEQEAGQRVLGKLKERKSGLVTP